MDFNFLSQYFCSENEQDLIFLNLMNLIANNHYNNFFMGDIKPDNILFDD